MKTADKENIRCYELQSVNHALDLIDALITAREGLTLSHLSRSSGLSKNKIFRMLSTLEQRGMVQKDRNCQYRLGISAFGTAHRILSSQSLLDHARPVMAELAARLNEAVYLATMVGGEAMFQEMSDCCQSIRTGSFVGSRFPLPDVTVSGSVMEQIDVDGVTVYVSELNAEVTTVAVMLMDSSSIAGALVVLAPTFRMPIERIRSETAASLSASAQQVSMVLGTAKVRTMQAPVLLKQMDYAGKPPVNIATVSENYSQPVRKRHY